MNPRNRQGRWILPLVLLALTVASQADQLELTNGDRYIGKVIAVTETNITLRSEINGLMRLPRSSVSGITFGDKQAARTTTFSSDAAKPATKPPDLATQIKARGIDPKSIKQVQEQILGATTPEV